MKLTRRDSEWWEVQTVYAYDHASRVALVRWKCKDGTEAVDAVRVDELQAVGKDGRYAETEPVVMSRAREVLNRDVYA